VTRWSKVSIKLILVPHQSTAQFRTSRLRRPATLIFSRA
jgi:hypothetical protein